MENNLNLLINMYISPMFPASGDSEHWEPVVVPFYLIPQTMWYYSQHLVFYLTDYQQRWTGTGWRTGDFQSHKWLCAFCAGGGTAHISAPYIFNMTFSPSALFPNLCSGTACTHLWHCSCLSSLLLREKGSSLLPFISDSILMGRLLGKKSQW